MRVIQKKEGILSGIVWSPGLGATIITMLILVAIPVTLLLTNTKQDTQQHASSGSQNAMIEVDPTSGTYSVGQKFAISILVSGGLEKFNSAKATIGVSPNLSVESLAITPEAAGGCEFTFTDPSTKPDDENLSFYGILPNGPIASCNLYTLTLSATAPGTASVFITNGSVTSPNNLEILQETKDATYTITQ